jgi:hypothetical protein
MMNESKADDLVSVLRNLGYKKIEAERRALGVLQRHSDEEMTLEALIKEALAWSHRETGSLKVQVVEAPKEVPIKGLDDEEMGLPVPPKPRMTTKLVWEPPPAEPEDDESTGGAGGKAWLIVMGTLSVLAGFVWWLGVPRFLLVLAGLLTFFYVLGKTVGKKDE